MPEAESREGAVPGINRKTEQRNIIITFALYNLGVFLFWSSFVTLFNLQSSINIEKGLGTTTIAASYYVSASFSIFAVPFLIQKLGRKKCLLMGDASMFLFLLSNLYPRYYTLLPAGIMMTIMQSAAFPSTSLLNVKFAALYSTVSKRSKDECIAYFSGYFFTSFQASQVFGNLVSYFILYGLDQVPTEERKTNCTSMHNNSCITTDQEYRSCGVNDCQNATIVSENIDQYRPVNIVSLYVLIGIAFIFEMAALIIHGCFLPSDDCFEETLKRLESVSLPEEAKLHDMPTEESDDEKCVVKETGQQRSCDDRIISSNTSQNSGILELIVTTTKAVFIHLMTLKLILLIPITVYNGLAMSFVFNELTRSFSSCILGVQWVGICMACYGCTDAMLSWAVGKYGRRVGRIWMFLFAVLLECGNYVYCLLWSPSSNMLLSILALFFAFGITDGIIQIIVNVTHIDFFPDNREVAVVAWNFIFVFGFSSGYALSTAFCVKTRVFLNIGFLLTGFVCVGFADLYNRRSTLTKKADSSNSEGQTTTET